MIQGQPQTVKIKPQTKRNIQAKRFFYDVINAEIYQRFLFGTLMAGISLGVAYLGALPFAALILIINLFMSWEWSRLTGHQSNTYLFLLQNFACTSVILTAAFEFFAAALAIVFATAVIGFLLHKLRGESTSTFQWSPIGILCITLPSLSLIWIRHDDTYGLYAVLFIFAIVWITDSAAYLVGKTVGGVKLWPSVSPGKTWSGFCGGAVASMICGLGFALYLSQGSMVLMIFLSLVLSLSSQLGDLFESAVKRNFGLKNSSSLIPGHGGVWDRVDGLIFAATMAGLFALTVDMFNPGKALLTWGS